MNFVLEDLTCADAPLRVIPFSHRDTSEPPDLISESKVPRDPDGPTMALCPWSFILFQFLVRFPKAMKQSVLCPLPAGSAIVRDLRLWHGGTPSGSSAIRFSDQILKPEASDAFVNLQSEYVIE